MKRIKPRRCLILSVYNDLHGLAIQRVLQKDHGLVCHVVETNVLASSGGFSGGFLGGEKNCAWKIKARDGSWVAIEDVSLVWWRRVNYPQIGSSPDEPDRSEADDFQRRFINNEWKHGVYGAFLSSFEGVFISDPDHSRRAQNKILQLRIARKLGLRIPQTLVSQSPKDIQDFCHHMGAEKIVVKAQSATDGRCLAAVTVNPTQLYDSNVEVCPAIYQEYIPGRRHLRINCFGDSVYAFRIETDAVDWRRDRQSRIEHVQLDDTIARQFTDLVKAMGLEMGIIDAKLASDDQPVFLEVNPQGQFLFAEGLTGFDLTTPFAAFLASRVGEAVANPTFHQI